jgi:uncharacterized protein
LGAGGRRALRVVIDINVFISALIAPTSIPAKILQAWRRGRFELLTCDELLDELRKSTRYPKVRSRISPIFAGILINEIGKFANHGGKLPKVDVSPDPSDNYLLALAQAGKADYLVTGDKADLLMLGRHGATRIVSVRQFAELIGLAPPSPA